MSLSNSQIENGTQKYVIIPNSFDNILNQKLAMLWKNQISIFINLQNPV